MIPDSVDLTQRHESSAVNTFRLVPDPPLFVKGEGAWLIDDAGERYLDLVCGSATTSLGHGHPAHRAAIRQELECGILHTGTRLPSRARADLYRSLASILPARLDTYHLANSGAEAIETAMKAAIFATGASDFVAFEGGYHGRTLGALSLTHGPGIREPFLGTPRNVDFLPYPAHGDAGAETLAALARRLADARQGRGRPVAAVVFEAVQGVSGVVEPAPDFWKGVEAIARRHGVLMLADEIWSGFGRAGRMFAFQRAGIEPDLVAMGKALSASLPLSTVAGPSEILKSWRPGSHTSTFQGNPLAAAAAVATIETLVGQEMIERVTTLIEPALRDGLAPLSADCDIRVVGAQAAIDLGSVETSQKVQRIALAEKLLVYGGGRNGECVMIVPPLVIDTGDLRPALAVLVGIVQSVLAASRSAF